MARGTTIKAGVSKVRLVVFEAEVSDGDLSQFTQAIQNALLPRQPSAVRVISQTPKGITDESDTLIDANEIETDEQEVSAPTTSQRPPRQTKTRAIKPPKVVDNVDWEASQSLRSYVEDFDFKTNFERYLAVALWFKEFRETPAINASHVYTAFRHLGWSTAIPDFDKPFRNMRDNQLFTGGSKEGFAINQLGEGKIKAKRRAST